MMSVRFSGFDGMAGSQNRHGWAQMPLGAIGECSFDKSLKWALFRASKDRIRSYRKKSFRNLDISFYDSKPADFVSSQKKSDLYFRRNHDRTTDT